MHRSGAIVSGRGRGREIQMAFKPCQSALAQEGNCNSEGVGFPGQEAQRPMSSTSAWLKLSGALLNGSAAFWKLTHLDGLLWRRYCPCVGRAPPKGRMPRCAKHSVHGGRIRGTETCPFHLRSPKVTRHCAECLHTEFRRIWRSMPGAVPDCQLTA